MTLFLVGLAFAAGLFLGTQFGPKAKAWIAKFLEGDRPPHK